MTSKHKQAGQQEPRTGKVENDSNKWASKNRPRKRRPAHARKSP
ncbi:MAG: hypothetical protein JWR60_3822 [Polaromonas sp.]|nr:hypothetical protein [Polaromonas sp.]